MRIAALDFGTVTSRLMVADVENAIVSPLIKKTTITHLGEGLAASGRISEAAIKRLLEATQAFLSEIDSLNGGEALGFPPVSAIRAVATSAMRDAKNSDEVADALAGIGVQLEVISGDQEARLNVEGTLSGFAAADLLGRTVLVIDVGGGSTELVIARVDEIGKAPQIVMMSSLDIGARRITDLWLKSDPPLLSELNDARDWLVLQTKAFLDDFKSSGLAIDQVFAVAGTPTTLVAIRDKLAVYDPSHVHGQVVTLQQWQTVFDKLSAMPLQQRSQVVGLEPERAPIMVGGIMILDHIMHALELPKVTVSESDILQGVLLDTWRQSASPSPSIP